jgi:putative ABC transport system ATP-binding protein
MTITIKDVHKHYQLGKTVVKALRGVDLKIGDGDFVFIVGPSGSGKSTLMHIVGALEQPTKGTVELGDLELQSLDDWQLSMIRRNKVGFIFQEFNLVNSLNAIDNVVLPLMTSKKPETELIPRAVKLLKEVGLGDRLYHNPNELSGGERQRVAIARALINNPAIVLADEPTGNLDSKTGAEIFALMRKLNKEEGKTFVIVTHDTEYIREGDLVYHLKDGVVIETYRHNEAKNHLKPKKSKIV